MLELASRHERWIVLAGLVLVAALGLTATLKTGGMLMMWPATRAVGYAVLLFIMWWTMMLAMMLPSAAPAILTYSTLSQRFTQQGGLVASVIVFVAGYIAVWTVFSVAAVILQLATQNFVTLTGMMAVTSSVVGGGLLIAAGLYQMSPLKYACLRKCQSPLMFFARSWRKGSWGAFTMGVEHGTYCVGCCWVLMGLLFYGGVMELTWIVAIAVYIAAEKLIPVGTRLSAFSGLVLSGWGVWILARVYTAS
jgi:predicted metal-binding membrane protein